MTKYEQHYGKKLVEKAEFENAYEYEVKEFDLLEYLWGIKNKKHVRNV